MKEKTCCFSGHRIISSDDYETIKKSLYNTVEDLIKNGVIYFGSGGAMGFDTLAAEAVIELRKKYSQVRLIMVYPCRNQTVFWKEKDRERYEKIKAVCDKTVYISESYDKNCMMRRNRHLVDCSGYCVCFLKKADGGTAYTVNYAVQKGLKIINIAKN